MQGLRFFDFAAGVVRERYVLDFWQRDWAGKPLRQLLTAVWHSSSFAKLECQRKDNPRGRSSGGDVGLGVAWGCQHEACANDHFVY